MKGLRLSLKLLMHTKIGIRKTLSFLKETRLCTRKWHLERRQEEAGEAGEAGEVEEAGEAREAREAGEVGEE